MASGRRRLLWINLLFAAGLALAVPWFAAGVLAHRQGGAAGVIWASQRAYAVRTFWIGALGLLAPLAAPGVGLALLGLAWIWCAARLARGFAAWEAETVITDPGRFL